MGLGVQFFQSATTLLAKRLLQTLSMRSMSQLSHTPPLQHWKSPLPGPGALSQPGGKRERDRLLAHCGRDPRPNTDSESSGAVTSLRRAAGNRAALERVLGEAQGDADLLPGADLDLMSEHQLSAPPATLTICTCPLGHALCLQCRAKPLERALIQLSSLYIH